MNVRVFYVPFNALLGYIGTSTSEGMKSSTMFLSDPSGMQTHTSQWSDFLWSTTLIITSRRRFYPKCSEINSQVSM